MEKKRFLIELTTEMLGTVPMDPEVYATYVASKRPPVKVIEGAPPAGEENEADDIDKIEEKGWTGFRKDEKGLYIYDYMIRGFLKNAGEVLSQGIMVTKEKKDGSKKTEKLAGVKTKIDKYVFVFPRKIYLGQNEPDGVVERSLRAMTRLGPRVTLARSDYINAGKKIEFVIWLLPQKEITWGMIDQFFEYGELCGIGQFRNGSYGRFRVLETEMMV